MLKRTSRSSGPGSPDVTGFYDQASGSIQYVAACPETKKAALIDVVQDFDTSAARTRFDSAQEILDFVAAQGLEVVWVLDTHPHADHLMASRWLKDRTGAPNAIGEKVRDIAVLWRELYHLPEAFQADRHFDRLLADGETFGIGNMSAKVMLSPGHTLGSISFVIGDACFAHDTFMQPDAGTARADFPGGSAAELYESLMAILALPDETRVFIGHDYGTETRKEPAWEATVREQRETNKHVGGGTPKTEYVGIREARDRTLRLPDRMLHALQVNLRAGALPPAEADGNAYFKIPANRF